MAVINHAKREINAKLVYYGPPGSGKGTLLKYIHQRIKPSLCGSLKTMDAGADSLLFFDYVPFESSSLNGYRIRFHLYTLTGPVANPGTWKMTLKGVDGIVFMTGDDQDAADEALRVLRTMLSGYGRQLEDVPRFWLSSADNRSLSDRLAACFDAEYRCQYEAESGSGVLAALAKLSQEVLQRLRNEVELEAKPVTDCQLSAVSAGAVCPVRAELPVASVCDGGDVHMAVGGGTTLQVPLVIGEGKQARRYNLTLTINLEDLGDSSP